MTQTTSHRAAVRTSVLVQLNLYRVQEGDTFHAATCLGIIDAAATSLQRSHGPDTAAATLYRAADDMVGEMPLPARDFVLRRRGPLERLGRLYRDFSWIAYSIGVAVGLLVGRLL